MQARSRCSSPSVIARGGGVPVNARLTMRDLMDIATVRRPLLKDPPGHPADHPTALAHPEGEYLKALLLRG